MSIFRGWLELGERELANSSRVVALARPAAAPASDAVAFAGGGCAPCRNLEVGRDDSWPGLHDYLGAVGPYTDITTAPWYDPADPASGEFYGIWVMSAEGFDAIPVARDIGDAICAGGVAGRHRDTYRTLSFSALLWACTHRGAQYGLRWLNCLLRTARTPQTLRYLSAHPEAGTADRLERALRRVVLTSGAVVREVAGRPIADHQQASMYRVEWELAALDPYEWTATTSSAVTWDSTVVAGIEWAHAPDCVDTSSCALPELLSVECPPQVIDTRPAPTPVCGGCLPVCEIETRTWQMDLTDPTDCEVIATSIQVSAGADPVTVQLWWRPCGSTSDCDITGQLQITGLPAGQTVVADSLDRRAYAVIDGQRVRQRGIVGTPSGAPWRATLLTPGCWELVAQSAPGLDYTVTVSTTGRTA
ncbi:sugar transferase [Nocardia farcinica]|uniref:sugar transferase n=1 Tax=Nocardia farcinica TaxID=37329 RepID=UPI00342D6DBE